MTQHEHPLIQVEVPIQRSKFPAYGDLAVMRRAGQTQEQIVRLLGCAAPFDVRATRTIRERSPAWIDERPLDGGPPMHHPASTSTTQLFDGIQRYHAELADAAPDGRKLPPCHQIPNTAIGSRIQ